MEEEREEGKEGWRKGGRERGLKGERETEREGERRETERKNRERQTTAHAPDFGMGDRGVSLVIPSIPVLCYVPPSVEFLGPTTSPVFKQGQKNHVDVHGIPFSNIILLLSII